MAIVEINRTRGPVDLKERRGEEIYKKIVTFALPDILLKKMDLVVKCGIHRSYSDLIRRAIEEKLKKIGGGTLAQLIKEFPDQFDFFHPGFLKYIENTAEIDVPLQDFKKRFRLFF